MHARTATHYPGSLDPGVSRLPGDCLHCSVPTNLCVSCVAVLRIPQTVNAANVVCQADYRVEKNHAPKTDSGRR